MGRGPRLGVQMRAAKMPRDEDDERQSQSRPEPVVRPVPPGGVAVQRMQQALGNRATVSMLVQRDLTLGGHRRRPGGTAGPGGSGGSGSTTTTITPTTAPTPTPTPTPTTVTTPTTTPPVTDTAPLTGTAPTTTGPPPVVRSPLQVKFAAALGAKKVSLKSLRTVYAKADPPGRKTIGDDRTLTDRARALLPAGDWLQMMAELGVQRTDGTVAHTTAKQADDSVRAEFEDFVGKQVKAGKSVVGRVVVLDGEDWLTAYYHEFPHELPRGGPTDDEPSTNAFTTTSKPKDIIVLNKSKGNAGTSVHEGMHLYQHDASMKLGSNFQEGLTEWLTRHVTTPMGIARNNYGTPHDAVAFLATVVPADVLKAAYFKGDVAGLRKAFTAFRVGKGDNKKVAAGRFDELVQAFRDDDWGEVANLLG